MSYQKSLTKIKFVYEHEGNVDTSFPETKVEYVIDGESNLNQCVEAFENFLLACGYRLGPNKSIEIIEDGDYYKINYES